MGNRPEMRRIELEAAKAYLWQGARVLELGGGNGYQASLMQAWGCDVTSYDLCGRPKETMSFFPVRDFDGRHIPEPDSSFDIAFSSNVLEHVPHVEELLREASRITKPTGLGIHTMPTTAWRFWTSLAHYPHLMKRLFSKQASASRSDRHLSEGISSSRSLARRVLSAGAHGAYRSALAELWYFSCPRWRRVFDRCGYRVQDVIANGVTYTGYGLLPRLSIPQRRVLARLAGSSCRIFIVRPPEPGND